MAQQHSHVPKFGNWESDNIQYTAFFENARKDKAGMINPNDPEQNPEAFISHGRESKVELSFGQKKNVAITSSESESGGSSDNPLLQQRPGNSTSLSTSSAVSRRQRKTSESHDPSSDNTNRHERGASIPKFGAWDEADPSSGAGFTVIFNKVKEEKQTASTKLPSSLPHSYSHTQTNQTSSSVHESKFCCCLFSCARK